MSRDFNKVNRPTSRIGRFICVVLFEKCNLIGLLLATVVPLLVIAVGGVVCLTDVLWSDYEITMHALIMFNSSSITDSQVTILDSIVNRPPGTNNRQFSLGIANILLPQDYGYLLDNSDTLRC